MLLLFLLAACKEEASLPTPERELQVLVVNSENKPVKSAEVRVYTTASDWATEKNAAAKNVTDATGTALLTGLGADSLWIKATWIDYSTKEVFQNTLVSFEPVEPVPAHSRATYRVKVNSAKVLKGIRIKEVECTGIKYNNCDTPGSYYSEQYEYVCGRSFTLRDVSAPGCDLYLLIEDSKGYYSDVVSSYFFRSAVKTDNTDAKVVFEVNDTISDFSKPYYIGVREHLIVNPEAYNGAYCSNTYPSLGAYLASEEGQDFIFNVADRYITSRVPLLNVNNSIMPAYPADEWVIKLSSYDTQELKLHLEWIY